MKNIIPSSNIVPSVGGGNGGTSMFRKPDIATEEQRLGQPNFVIPGMGRWQAPEDANADASYMDPLTVHQMGIVQVPPIIPVKGNFTLFSVDYNTLANYKYVKSALNVLGAAGRNDQSDYELLLTANATGLFQAGGAANISGLRPFSSPNLVIGFQVEWGLNILNYAPFSMTLRTFNFRGQHYQQVDRRVVVRFDSSQGADDSGSSSNGGVFQVLFGQRLTYNDSCGCGGYWSTQPAATYQAAGGMNKAIVQNAVIPGQYGPAIADGAAFMPPYSVINPDDLPYIQIQIPPNLEDGFAATIHLITAASPFAASLREALFVDGLRE